MIKMSIINISFFYKHFKPIPEYSDCAPLKLPSYIAINPPTFGERINLKLIQVMRFFA